MSLVYLDTRVRLHHNRHGIFNKHLLVSSVYNQDTAAVIYVTSAKAFDVLCPCWKDTTVGASTDGERNVTGRISGVLKWFQNFEKPGLVYIWWGAYYLDIVIQSF